MDCCIVASICILVISLIQNSGGQMIIKDEPWSFSSPVGQEQFHLKVQEIFRELYLTQFIVFEKKITDMITRQEQDLKNVKRKITDSHSSWQQTCSDLVARVSNLEKNQAEQKLKAKFTYLNDSINEQNDTINEIMYEQKVINNSTTKILNSLDQLERKYEHLNNSLNTQIKDNRDNISRRKDIQTEMLMMHKNVTLLEIKVSFLQNAVGENNKTVKNIVEGQNEISRSVVMIRDNLGQLEAKSLSFDENIIKQNKTVERIWNSCNKMKNRIESVVSVNNNQSSEITMMKSNDNSAKDIFERAINKLNESVSFAKAEIVTLERKINNNTNVLNVRVVNGSTWNEGRVEVFYNGEWGTVCDDIWTDKNAHVICRHLGYFSGIPFREATFGKGEGRIWMDELNCTGSESNIFDCARSSIGNHNCGHNEDAGVACMKSFAVRLMNGNSISRDKGRVEILIDGKWGTICDDNWDTNAAKVVCRYLGYTGTAVAYSEAAYGQGGSELPIYLDNVDCAGSESYIFDCQHKGVGSHDCSHSEDASVKCSRA